MINSHLKLLAAHMGIRNTEIEHTENLKHLIIKELQQSLETRAGLLRKEFLN